MSNLVKEKQYIMYLTDYKEDRFTNFCKGMFRGVHSISKYLIFINVIEKETYPEEILYLGNRCRQTALVRKDLMFVENDAYTFHDLDQLKENKKKAIESMEKRSLDIVLKRLVNEHFEW